MRDLGRSGGVGTADIGDPQDDTRAFRQSLGNFATGVTVITASDGKQRVGITANSFSSVSLDPPLILWSADKKSTSLPTFLKSGHFAINVLSAGQVEVAANFAKSGGDKYAAVDWEPGIEGVPLITGAVAGFECSRFAEHDAGDHIIFIGRVERFRRYERPLLIFAQGRYGLLAEYVEADKAPKSRPLSESTENLFFTQMRDTLQVMSTALRAHRHAEGLNTTETRVLWQAGLIPGATMDTLARRSFLAIDEASEVVATLIERGLLANPANPVLSDAGADKLSALRRRTRSYEIEKLRGVDAADIDGFWRVLEAFRTDS
ncbi:MAG: flavin reductase [Flavobacteriaceae bacterium]